MKTGEKKERGVIIKKMEHELKQRFLKWFIHNNNLISKGVGLLNTPKQIAQYVLGVTIVLKLFFDPAAEWYIYANIGIGLAFLISAWGTGWWWDKSQAYQLEAEWGNKRNPFVGEMRNTIIKESKNGKK